MYFYLRGDSTNLRNRLIRTRENRKIECTFQACLIQVRTTSFVELLHTFSHKTGLWNNSNLFKNWLNTSFDRHWCWRCRVTNTICSKHHTGGEEEETQTTDIEANTLKGQWKGLGRRDTEIDASEDLMTVGMWNNECNTFCRQRAARISQVIFNNHALLSGINDCGFITIMYGRHTVQRKYSYRPKSLQLT